MTHVGRSSKESDSVHCLFYFDVIMVYVCVLGVYLYRNAECVWPPAGVALSGVLGC
jgi:hypothetical protein